MSEQKPHLQDLFIGIAGLIGAGKSTLATALGDLTGLPVYYEQIQDNEYLADFCGYSEICLFNADLFIESPVSSSIKRLFGRVAAPFRTVLFMKMRSLQRHFSI